MEGDEEWDEQMQADENEKAGFETSNRTPRSPVKTRNTLTTKPPSAPKKSTIKATTEIEEPSSPTRYNTRPTRQQAGESTEIAEAIEVMPEESNPT